MFKKNKNKKTTLSILFLDTNVLPVDAASEPRSNPMTNQ